MLESTDLDGIIAKNNLNRADYKPFKMHKYYRGCSATGYAKRCWNLIITARKEFFRPLTVQWLDDNNVCYQELIMLPNGVKKTYKNIVKFKADMINKFDIDIYYEDDVEIANYLKINCPNSKIVFIRNNDLY